MLAENIRLRREKKHYTQAVVAARLGISQNAYSKVELGYTQLTIQRLFELADVLDCEAIDLLNNHLQYTRS